MYKRQPHMDALKELYTMASTDVPVEQRQMAKGENHLRPHLIHFNRCKNVLLDEFKIRQSPFWTIHLYMCDDGIVRNLDVKAHGHNNDGIDLEMSRNFLIENLSLIHIWNILGGSRIDSYGRQMIVQLRKMFISNIKEG